MKSQIKAQIGKKIESTPQTVSFALNAFTIAMIHMKGADAPNCGKNSSKSGHYMC
jgi:hypothetical protein